jgi:uncharacterized membrane protein
MKRLFGVLILVLLLIPSGAEALDIESYDVDFDIQENIAVKETVTIFLSEMLNESKDQLLKLGDVSNVMVIADGSILETEVIKDGDDTEVSFTLPEGTETIIISFQANNIVFQSGGVFQFFVNLNAPGDAENVGIKVLLPKGYVLFRNIYTPGGASVGTDGERIFLEWDLENTGESLPILIQFESVFDTNMFIPPAAAAVVVAAVVIVYFLYRKRSRRDFLLSFFEDERKVVLELMQEKIIYQNKIEKKYGFSRAKVTRIMQKLERKGLIKREKVGRTMRIQWKGK